jgi:DNA primase
MDPCELRQGKGDTAVRDLVARRQRLIEFWIRAELAEQDLEAAEGRVQALRRTVPLIAQIKDVSLRDEYARQLAGWIGWDDIQTVVRRVRETSSGKVAAPSRKAAPVDANQGALAIEVQGPRRPKPNDPELHLQREALKSALQVPHLAGPVFDSLPPEAFTEPAYLELHQGLQAAGGTSSGLAGPALYAAIAVHCQHQVVQSLVNELSVEPMHARSEPDLRYVESLMAALNKSVVARQIADIKSRLQRLSPLENADEYRALFGDLVAMEQYHKALGEQASGSYA